MLPMPGSPRLITLTFLVFFSSIASSAQNPTSSDSLDRLNGQLPSDFVQMLKGQVSWDMGFNNPSGPRLHFTKIDEFDRADGHFTRFRIYAEGVPEGKPYILAIWKIGVYLKNIQILSSSAYVNHKGLVLTKAPSPDADDRDVVSDGTEFDVGIQAANGEPIRFLLRSKDNKVMVPGTLVPYPIDSVDHDCKLTARLAVPEGQAILVEGDGFAPNSEVTINGDSAGELKVSKHGVDERGHLQVLEMPFVIGKEAGILKETITTKECTVSVSIPWGKGTYQKH